MKKNFFESKAMISAGVLIVGTILPLAGLDVLPMDILTPLCLAGMGIGIRDAM